MCNRKNTRDLICCESEKYCDMLSLPPMMDPCVASVKLSLDAQRGGTATGYCSLCLLLTGSGFCLYQRSKADTGPKNIGYVPVQRVVLCFLHSDSWVPQGLLHQRGARWRSGGPACPLCKHHLTSSGAAMYPPSFSFSQAPSTNLTRPVNLNESPPHHHIRKFPKSLQKCTEALGPEQVK